MVYGSRIPACYHVGQCTIICISHNASMYEDAKGVLPYHPQSNGICERMNGTIKSMLGSYTQHSQKIWADILPHIVFAYNTSIHSTTGYTPYYMNHGREACIGSESVLRGEGNVREKTEYIRNVQLNMAMAHRHVTNRIDATDARDRLAA